MLFECFVFNAPAVSQLQLETSVWTGGFVQVTTGSMRKYKSSRSGDRSRNNLNAFSYLLTLPWSSLKTLLHRETFMKVKAPFAGHPAAFSAWLPAAIPSLLGGLESHCNKQTQ